MRFVIAYTVSLFSILFLLFAASTAYQLLAGALLVLMLLWLLLLLHHTSGWRSADYQGALFIILAGTLLVLVLGFPLTFFTYALGAVLVLAAVFLLVHRLVLQPRSDTLFDRFANGGPGVERLEQADAPTLVVARQGGRTYHLADCRVLGTHKLVTLSAGEAEAYGLKPCKVCRP